MKLRNTNPLGRVDVPILRREGDVSGEGVGCLEPGEVFEVDDELGAHLLEQVGNYETVDEAALSALTVPALQQYAAGHGVDLSGLTKKAEIIRAIEKG